MTQPPPTPAPLPTMDEITNVDPNVAFKNDKFKLLLNQEVPTAWIKKNPYANNAKYLPIDKVEYLLDKLFPAHKVEVLRESTMFNSVSVTVRVHYLHPVMNEWFFHDGVGAKGLQHDSLTSLTMETIKDNAVEMALPIAKSAAVKDAADHLGKLFGRDLNRKDTLTYKQQFENEPPPPKITKEAIRMLELIKVCTTHAQLSKLKKDLATPAEFTAYDDKWDELK